MMLATIAAKILWGHLQQNATNYNLLSFFIFALYKHLPSPHRTVFSVYKALGMGVQVKIFIIANISPKNQHCFVGGGGKLSAK